MNRTAMTGAVPASVVVGSGGDLRAVGLVAWLTSCYATVLVLASSFLDTVAVSASGSSAGVLLAVVSVVFVMIALYVATVVIINCVDTVIAGRLHRIALLRLLGASSRALRSAVVRSTGIAGAVGAVAGSVVGFVVAQGGRLMLVADGRMPDLDYRWIDGRLVVVLGGALAAITAAAMAAGWVGSRPVLTVTPAQAMSTSQAALPVRPRASLMRAAVSGVLLVGGGGLLVAAMLLGEAGSAAGFLFAFFGAAISASGVLIGARLVIPCVVAGFGLVLGRAPAGVLARRNAIKDPLRTTRSTLGLVIGVCLVTTIAAGMNALQTSVKSWQGLSVAQREQTHAALSMVTAILIAIIAIIAISSIIAAVGFVSTMSLTVIQRRREFGLLRALGFTRRQVAAMITMESFALSIAGILFGLALGVGYGTAGAQSLIGALSPGFIWGVPVAVLITVGVAGFALMMIAARVPAQRAVRVSPIEALRVDA